ncbi:hypothetical protein DFQ27_003518 [Actinomortierella ambigua]|uniref:Uncharacterized protein n=1 Tax=Actinomortierella ambigua TaxID=1343610 RepID=A0A9P6U5U8_9FUNG|nr:hypothetical protein DFQ27_003518 [Actinomortierella ambigua]
MLTNIETTVNNQRYVEPLPMSAVYNKQQFITQFASLHHHSIQPVLVHQLLATQANISLNDTTSSYFPHTVAEFWILYDDLHRPIACAGANTAMADSSVGYVGLFEARDVDAGVIVLNAATNWLRRGGVGQFQPVRQILGPVNLTTWLHYRLRVDDDPAPSMSYEPDHPKFYQTAFAKLCSFLCGADHKAGFVKAVDYYTMYYDMDPFIDRLSKYCKDVPLESTGFALQAWNTLDFTASLNPERHPALSAEDNVARRVYDLSIRMFGGKDLFDEQVTRETHRRVVLNDLISRPEVDLASLLDLSSFVVDIKTGQDVGYLACWVENQDTLVMKTVGYVPEVHHTRVFAYTILETNKRARQAWGCTRNALALMNDRTTSQTEYIVGPSTRHVYRLYVHKPQVDGTGPITSYGPTLS